MQHNILPVNYDPELPVIVDLQLPLKTLQVGRKPSTQSSVQVSVLRRYNFKSDLL